MGYENPNLDGLDRESIKNELVKQYTHHTQIFDEEDQDPSFVKCKFVIVGAANGGKTSWVTRLTQHNFNPGQKPTVGAQFALQGVAIDEYVYNIEMWDVSGDSYYKDLVPMYLQYANAAIVIFDVADHKSFEEAKTWVKYVKDIGEKGMFIALVGTKCDMLDIATYPVTKHEIENFANEQEILNFPRVSAKNGEGVEEVLVELSESIHELNLKTGKLKDNGENVEDVENLYEFAERAHAQSMDGDKLEEFKEQLSGCAAYMNILFGMCFKNTKEATKIALEKTGKGLKQAGSSMNRKSRKFGQDVRQKYKNLTAKDDIPSSSKNPQIRQLQAAI
mmetsp:Transcript_32238/g.39651  ORF Transcript_32238/g.39651 Transcript_32238/m.39651 type:complete len:334 (-) Transcript_32238:242-1243(-)